MLLNKKKIRNLKLLYLFYILLAVIVGIYPSFKAGISITSYQLGVTFGAIGISLLALQPLLSSRLPQLEREVGLDRIMRWHAANAKFAALLVVLHPIFLFYDQVALSGLSQVVSTFTIYHWMGISALVLILITVTLAVYSDRIGISYELWKFLHRAGYLIIILGFAHSRFISADFAIGGPFYYWWFVVGAVVLTGLGYRYIIRPVLIKDNLYRTVEVKRVANKIHSVTMEPLHDKVIDYFPGQYAFVKFESARVPKEEHHFTISSSPGDNNLTFTIKASGDFTNLIGKLRRGDKAKIEGPFGVFSNVGMTGPFVFIAAGIGITPIYSMLSFMKKSGIKEKTALLYSASTYKDLAFFRELSEMTNSKWLEAKFTLSQEKREGFLSGRINKAMLRQVIKNKKNAKVFLVGPPPMMESVQKDLRDLGISKDKIFTERFALK